MMTIGEQFPEFALKGVVSPEAGQEFQDVTNRSYPGKWLVLFSWPMDSLTKKRRAA